VGAPFTVILRGESMPGSRKDGLARSCSRWLSRERNDEDRLPAGAGNRRMRRSGRPPGADERSGISPCAI
jgi:hypothetical protein